MVDRKFIQHSLIVAFSLVGFFIHLFIITARYLQFEIETVVETNFAENTIVIPDLSLCKSEVWRSSRSSRSSLIRLSNGLFSKIFQQTLQGNYIIDLLDEKRLQASTFPRHLVEKQMLKDGESNSSLKDLIRENNEIYRLFEEHFDTDAIMNELAYPHEQIISEIKYLTQNSSFLGLDDSPKCTVTVYSQRHDICFSVQCSYSTMSRKKHNAYTDRNTLLKSANKNALLKMQLNQMLLNEIKSPFQIFIFETGLNFTFKASTITSISLLNDVPRHYDMTYQRFRNIRLPPPYTSECMDYFESGFFSRNHKLEHCINEEARNYAELQNKTFFGNVVYSGKRNLHFDIYRQNLNRTAQAKIKPILDAIFDFCAKGTEKKECYSQKFTPYMLKQRILGNDSEYSSIQLLASTLPEIKNTAKPKFTLVNLLLFYGSTLSLWFGLTIIRVVYLIQDAFNSATNKLRSCRAAGRRRAKLVLKVKDKLLTMRKHRLNGRVAVQIAVCRTGTQLSSQ